MRINFLTNPNTHISKTLSPTIKKPYPHISEFTSHSHEINTIEQFNTHLTHYASIGGCLLKGELTKPLTHESRAGSTSPSTPTEFIVFDIDRCALTITEPDQFISTCLPPCFNNVDYIWQWSNSAGITKHGLTGHIFFLLANPLDVKLLKKAIVQYNFLSEELESQIRLAHNGLTLTYGLDPTCAQNDKLIFIAPPILIDIENPYPERIKLVKKTNRSVQLSLNTINIAEIENTCKTKLNELRADLNFPRKKGIYKTDGNFEFLKNPEHAIFRGPYIDARGFRYGNLNNGDSYAYYHLLENPKYLYNFKGEPIVRLQDIDPDYWQQLQETQHPTDPTKQYLAFRDRRADVYYTVIYNKTTEQQETFAVSNVQKAIDFLKVHNQPIPETLPIWDVVFEPHQNYTINLAEQKLNLYQKTEYLKRAIPTKFIPPKFNNLITHVTGDDPAMRDDLLNWLAHIIQKRTKTQTAFVLHGRTGTGKGLLFTKILQPILGLAHCPMIMLDALDREFNEWIETGILVIIDETQISEDIKKAKKRINKIKNLITERHCLLKKKYVNAYQIENYVNFIFTSNEHDSIWINHDDRRFKVAPRQEHYLDYTTEDVITLENELQDITNYLTGYTINERAVNHVPLNNARTALIRAAQTSIDEFITHLKEGNLEELMQYHDEFINSKNAIYADKYKTLCESWLFQCEKAIDIPTSDLRVVYGFIFNQEISATRFGRILSSKGITIDVKRVLDKPVRCVTITWKLPNYLSQPDHQKTLCSHPGLTPDSPATKNARIN